MLIRLSVYGLVYRMFALFTPCETRRSRFFFRGRKLFEVGTKTVELSSEKGTPMNARDLVGISAQKDLRWVTPSMRNGRKHRKICKTLSGTFFLIMTRH